MPWRWASLCLILYTVYSAVSWWFLCLVWYCSRSLNGHVLSIHSFAVLDCCRTPRARRVFLPSQPQSTCSKKPGCAASDGCRKCMRQPPHAIPFHLQGWEPALPAELGELGFLLQVQPPAGRVFLPPRVQSLRTP